jgi:hypothetical protein
MSQNTGFVYTVHLCDMNKNPNMSWKHGRTDKPLSRIGQGYANTIVAGTSKTAGLVFLSKTAGLVFLSKTAGLVFLSKTAGLVVLSKTAGLVVLSKTW